MKRISPLIGGWPNCSSGYRALLVLVACAVIAPPQSAAQLVRGPHAVVGVGAVPGIGLQTGYVSLRSLYTIEGMLYVDGSPPFAGGQGSIQISGGLGGAVRVLSIMRIIGTPENVDRDFDVGLRFGPSLFFTVGESSREENPFSLFLEPFLRFSTTLGDSKFYFAELGIQRPFLRAGLWLRM